MNLNKTTDFKDTDEDFEYRYYSCPFCNFYCSNEEDLDWHLKEAHDIVLSLAY